MTKLVFLYFLLGLTSHLSFPSTSKAEAKPLFFKIVAFPQYAPTTGAPYTDFLTRKLQFLAGFLDRSGGATYNFGFNKFAAVAPSAVSGTPTTTTTRKPVASTEVQFSFVPESTDAMTAHATATKTLTTTTTPTTTPTTTENAVLDESGTEPMAATPKSDQEAVEPANATAGPEGPQNVDPEGTASSKVGAESGADELSAAVDADNAATEDTTVANVDAEDEDKSYQYPLQEADRTISQDMALEAENEISHEGFKSRQHR